MERCVGTVEDRTTYNITIMGEKYGAFKGKGIEAVAIGDTVEFSWDYDKTRTYRNIKGAVRITSARPAGVAGIPAPRPTWTPPAKQTLGIELGHAANLAMEMSCTAFHESKVGTPEFYKFFVEHTDKVFNIMKKIRESKENPSEPVELPSATDSF